ncbi:MAG: TonB-dependent receptor, partial [Bacteroidaceae bacterium]|nr:TonB-dependent receptor [Bacteroidaceae bacterium]
FTELYYKSATHEGNKGLKPEDSQSAQVGVSYMRPGLQATLRGFYHNGKNMIDWVMYTSDDVFHSTSFDLDNLGAQAEVKMNFSQLTGRNTWMQNLSLGYTYINQTRHDDQQIFKSNYALEYLRHKFTASLSHRIVSKLSAFWNVRWQDRMGSYVVYETNVETGKPVATNRLENYHPYATLDLKLQWTADKYDLYVQGNNLTDHRYYDLGNIPQPGLSILAGARVKIDW